MSKIQKIHGVKYIWVLGLLPFITHLIWLLNVEIKFRKSKLRQGVVLIKLPRKDAIDPYSFMIQIKGVYGDIYQPQEGDPDRRFDMIVLSATIDPIYTVDEMTEVWVSNMLVRTFFIYAFATRDVELIKSGIRNLIERMIRKNKNYLYYLKKKPVRKIKDAYVEGYLAKMCEPYIAQIPEKSYLRKKGIHWYAILPIFDSKKILEGHERKERLVYNVKSSVNALLTDLKKLSEKDERFYRVRTIAFPALAGSELLPDSRYYLSYKESFESILKAIEGTPLPSQLQVIYLVAWDKWDYSSLPQEGSYAISGLKRIYNEFIFTKFLAKFIGFSFLFIFGIVYLISRLRKFREYNRYFVDVLLTIVILIISIWSNFLLVGQGLSHLFSYIFNLAGSWGVLVTELTLGFFVIWGAIKTANLEIEKMMKIIWKS